MSVIIPQMSDPVPTAAELAVVENKLKRAHVNLMRSVHTCMFSGVILRGRNAVKVSGCPTAYTDGKNKYYGYNFFRELSQPQVTGIVLHENLHDALLHLYRDRDLRREDAQLYNAACDYAINDIILSIQDRSFIDLPEGRLYHPNFKGWSARQIYLFLRNECKPEQPQGKPCKKGQPGSGGQPGGSGNSPSDDDDNDGDKKKPGKKRVHGDAVTVYDKDGNEYPIGGSMDEHDYEPGDNMTPGEIEEEVRDVRDILQQGGILAGTRGGNVPRAIDDALTPRVNFVELMRDWMCETCAGKDDYTWRKYDRRRLPFELFMPSTESIAIGELLFCVDTSGSISNRDLQRVAGELSGLCEQVNPSAVRVLWWDTSVHAEQLFRPEQYAQIATLLKPQGGGGTHVSSVNDYVRKKSLDPVGVIVMTDGFVEDSIDWSAITCPTLWVLATRHRNDGFRPKAGTVITVDD